MLANFDADHLYGLSVLKSLHAVGWVHRDISSGNILVDEATKTVKLADVEYAKKIGHHFGDGHCDSRTVRSLLPDTFMYRN